MTLQQQQGISLPLVLALLLAMALLGAAVLQSGLLQTRMAVDAHTRNLAFQAAEGALRQGEQLAASAPVPTASGCRDGLCGTPDASAAERWKQPGFGGWHHAPAAQTIGLPAAYWLVEYMGQAPSMPGCERMQPVPDTCLRPLYRITARSTGGRGNVMLQAHYLDARMSWRELEIE